MLSKEQPLVLTMSQTAVTKRTERRRLAGKTCCHFPVPEPSTLPSSVRPSSPPLPSLPFIPFLECYIFHDSLTTATLFSLCYDGKSVRQEEISPTPALCIYRRRVAFHAIRQSSPRLSVAHWVIFTRLSLRRPRQRHLCTHHKPHAHH